MRSFRRTNGRQLGRRLTSDVALVCLADAVVGVSFGAITVSTGLPVWAPVLMSLIVFAGASQFMLVGIIASGGSLIAAVGAGLLANTRHLPFGFAVGNVLGDRLPRKLIGSHLLIDESVAFALAQREPERRRAAYWACGLSLFVAWNAAVAIGALAGRGLEDADRLGLDAAFPAVLLALVMPSLRDGAVRRAAVTGAAITLGFTPFLPAGLPVLLALAGLLTLRPTFHRRRQAVIR